LAKRVFFCQAEVFRQMVCEHAGGGCERPLLAREVPTRPRQGRQEIIKNLPNQQRELIKAVPRTHEGGTYPIIH
jgi:hypothetical protein